MKRIILVLAIFITTLAANASSFFGDKTSLSLTAAEAINKGQPVSIATNGDAQIFRNGDILIGKAESDVSAGGAIKIDIPKALQGVQVTFNNGTDLFEGGVANLSYSSYDSKSADITLLDDIRDVELSPDGRVLIILDEGSFTDRLEHKSIAVPWDISTTLRLTTNADTLDVTSEDASMKGLHAKPDGTKMFTVGNTLPDSVYQYDLTTAWDVTTGSYSGNSFSVNGQDTNPLDVFLGDDGSKAYVLGAANDTIYQYGLSTVWNASTASYSGNSFDVSSQTTGPIHLSLSPNGDAMYVTSTNTVYAYDLATPWNAATASYTGNSFLVETDVASEIEGFFINYAKDDAKMYIGVEAATDSVEQFSVVIDGYLDAQTPGVKYYTTPEGAITTTSAGGGNKPYGFAFSGTKLLLAE